MNLGRTILALLIALSVAMLPAVGAAGLGVKPADMVDMSAMEDMDCCPPDANPCKDMDKCASMAACALKCFSASQPSFSAIIFPSQLASLTPSLGTDPFHSRTSSPPFRPPRV
jgi:hypothetical protein